MYPTFATLFLSFLHLFIYLSIYLFTYLYICLYICLFVYQQTHLLGQIKIACRQRGTSRLQGQIKIYHHHHLSQKFVNLFIYLLLVLSDCIVFFVMNEFIIKKRYASWMERREVKADDVVERTTRCLGFGKCLVLRSSNHSIPFCQSVQEGGGRGEERLGDAFRFNVYGTKHLLFFWFNEDYKNNKGTYQVIEQH